MQNCIFCNFGRPRPPKIQLAIVLRIFNWPGFFGGFKVRAKIKLGPLKPLLTNVTVHRWDDENFNFLNLCLTV